MARSRRTTARLGLIALVSGAPLGCQSATQIKLELRTDLCKAPDGTNRRVPIAIYAGKPSIEKNDAELDALPTSTNELCENGAPRPNATFYLHPGDADDATIDIRVVAAVSVSDPKTCTSGNGYEGCVVQRRQTAYLPNETQTIVVDLDGECLGHACAFNSTCRTAGQCVSAILDPEKCLGPSGCNLDGQAVIKPEEIGPDPPAEICGPTASKTPPATFKKADALVSMGDTVCAVVEGVLRCWGYGEVGQLGVAGAPPSSSKPATVTMPVAPIAVPGLSHPFAALGAGADHGCAWYGGQLQCWGENRDGESDPTSSSPSALVPVRIGTFSGANPVTPEMRGYPSKLGLALGEQHSCVLYDAGTDAVPSAEVWCWGDNKFGQRGDALSGALPRRVELGAGNPAPVQIAAGGIQTCILFSDGKARCFGNNDVGSLGTGKIGLPGEPPSAAKDAANAATSATYERVAVSLYSPAFACGQVVGGGVECWGDNTGAQLGRPKTTDPVVTPAPVAGIPPARSLALGFRHACVVTPTNEVYCWGDNARGQIGQQGTEDDTLPPTKVDITDVKEIALGASHSCALKNDGSVWCWGTNELDQLGTPNAILSCTSTPVFVDGL